MKIIKDLKSFSKGSKKKMIVTIITNPCFHSVILYRISSFFYKIKMSPIAKLFWYYNRVVYNVDIDYRAQLAGGFVLIHGLGTVIGHNVQSRGRLTVYQNVTLGGNQGRTFIISNEVIDQPLIEDGVIIYSGASVYGPVYLKKGTHIKAGSVISEKWNDRGIGESDEE